MTQGTDRQALLRRETLLSAVVNAAISIGFFLLVFGWAPVATRSLAIDFLPQTFGTAFLGGLVPSFILLSKIRRGTVAAAGRVPTRAAQTLRVLGCALVATPVLGGLAALVMLAVGPSLLSPATALIVKALYGALVGIVTTPPVLRMALGMPSGLSIRSANAF
jgi:hypothetical protein